VNYQDGIEKKKQRGFSLIELMVGLAVLGLIVMGILAAFPASRLWISWAGEKTMESTYAASVLEILRNNSLLLQQQVLEDGTWTAMDDNHEDEVFTFVLGGKVIKAAVCPGMITSITARAFDDQVYYDGVSPEGIYQIGSGDNAQRVFFHGSLIEVNVEIDWAEGREGYQLSTVISSR
jgi:prepilin-type N-terminal cleavage/methylation domain-containing protein